MVSREINSTENRSISYECNLKSKKKMFYSVLSPFINIYNTFFSKKNIHVHFVFFMGIFFLSDDLQYSKFERQYSIDIAKIIYPCGRKAFRICRLKNSIKLFVFFFNKSTLAILFQIVRELQSITYC